MPPFVVLGSSHLHWGCPPGAHLDEEDLMHRVGKLLPLLFTVLGLARPGGLGATTLLPVEAEGLVDQASLIFVGTAIRQDVALSGDGSFPFTFVTFRVDQTLKGRTADGELTLAIPGGPLGDRFVRVEGAPEFVDGEDYLLFVSANGAREFPILGWTQGQFRFQRDPGSGRRLLTDMDGRAVLGIRNGRWVRTPKSIAPDGAAPDRDLGVKILWSDGAEVTPLRESVAVNPPLGKVAGSDQVLRSIRALVTARARTKMASPGGLLRSARAQDLPLNLSLHPLAIP